MRPIEELRDEASHVILHVGDMIYDVRTKSRGFLKLRERKIDIIEDDIYVWSIFWFSQDDNNIYNNLEFMEEEGLKLSIVIGTIELQSIKHGE
jgi:hypothetical protein|tara:strand:- start:177 stop:455 length:279 start_codon:yes stop_codon:yes gene_type:complete